MQNRSSNSQKAPLAPWPAKTSKNSSRRRPPCSGRSSRARPVNDFVRWSARRGSSSSGEAKSPTPNPRVTARRVAGIFFPQRPALRLTPHSYSPSVLGKIVRSGAREPSFEEAAKALDDLAELTISSRQAGRIAHAVGQRLQAHRAHPLEQFQAPQPHPPA